MDIIPAVHYNFYVCICRICHRHEEIHNTTGEGQFLSCALSFTFTSSPLVPLVPPPTFLLFQQGKGYHVITFIANYQSQAPEEVQTLRLQQDVSECLVCLYVSLFICVVTFTTMKLMANS